MYIDDIWALHYFNVEQEKILYNLRRVSVEIRGEAYFVGISNMAHYSNPDLPIISF